MNAIDVKSLTERARSARLVRVLGVYLVVAWAVLQAVDLLESQFAFPRWVFPIALGLLITGLPIVSATAIVQGALAAAANGSAGGEHTALLRRWLTWRHALWGGVLVFFILGSVGATVVLVRNRVEDLSPDAVAVLPFHAVGSDAELWREGLADLVATALDATGEFRAADPRAVLNRWRAMSRSDELPEPLKAAELAASLGAGRLILGSLIPTAPGQVRLSADLYSTRWARKEASAQVEGAETEITALVDRLTIELLRSVWREGSLPDVRVSALTTASVPALRFYLEGEQAYRRSQFTEAQALLARAIEEDSTFAVAHFRLAQVYGWYLGLGTSEITRYLAAAERHSLGLPERDSLLIRAWKLTDVDGSAEAIPLFRFIVSRYPDDLEAWHGLGDAVFHMGAQAGLPATAAIEPLERTLAIDSTFAPALIHLIEIAYFEGDSTRARGWTDRYLALDSTSLYAQSFRLLTPLLFGPDEAAAAAAAALDTATAELLMWAQARLRKSADDLSILERITRAATQARFTDSERGMALWHLGLAHLRRGHAARAVEILRESVALTGEDLQGAALSALAPARDVGIVADTAALRWLLELEARVGPRFYTLSVAAIRDGRVRLADQLVRQLEARADSALAGGDSLGSRWLRGEAETVSGRIAAARDSLDVAIERVRHGLSLINATWNLDLDRYWLAHAIKDRGGEPEAIAIFGSVYWTAWAEALGYLHRAQLHERRGETAESARYYARFIRLWRDADPHLQPQVEAARRALERLRGEPQPS